MSLPNWICCQLGAREHYSIPRALQQSGHLTALITDAWVPPQSALNKLPQSALGGLRDRYHPALSKAPVTAFTRSLIQFELKQRLQQKSPLNWYYMIERNHWFQKLAVQALTKLRPQIETGNSPPVLFTYSYAALDILRFAKQAGWTTVLGQMDPGIMEEKIVAKEYEKYSALASACQPIPKEYWQSWREECQLADSIVVNSDWSKKLLAQAGVKSDKVNVVPLVYSPPSEAAQFTRSYPEQFSRDRPLKVLFLGLLTLRKGIDPFLEAITRLAGQPIEFWLVGPAHIEIPNNLKNHPQIHWTGVVPRSQTSHYYRQADVFIFPTLSDGFGLTQLEAQAWKLPIIASQHCGQVVINNQNGQVLSKVSADAIESAILNCCNHPEKLAKYSAQSAEADCFQLQNLAERLKHLAQPNKY